MGNEKSGVVDHKSVRYGPYECGVHIPRTRFGGIAAVVVSEKGGATANGTSSSVCDGENVNSVSSAGTELKDPLNEYLSVGTHH